MHRARLFVILVLGLAAVAPASAQKPGPATASRQYAACMTLARKTPPKALDMARAWQARDGGGPARHCAAVALLGMGRHADAADALQALADDGTDGRIIALRPDILGQAGNAWLIADQPEKAMRALDRALALRPDDVDLLIDRAVALTSLKRYWDALGDLNRALVLAPRRPEALVFRAGAHREVDALDLAEADINRALLLSPGDPGALLELGLILNRRADPEGAKAAWRELLETSPDSANAKVARRYLLKLDAKN